jgi:ABC-type sugar transport system ATPase subunit
VRPADEGATGVRVAARVDLYEALGSTGIMIADVEGVRITALTSPERMFEYGQPIELAIDETALHYFDPATGSNLLQA